MQRPYAYRAHYTRPFSAISSDARLTSEALIGGVLLREYKIRGIGEGKQLDPLWGIEVDSLGALEVVYVEQRGCSRRDRRTGQPRPDDEA